MEALGQSAETHSRKSVFSIFKNCGQQNHCRSTQQQWSAAVRRKGPSKERFMMGTAPCRRLLLQRLPLVESDAFCPLAVSHRHASQKRRLLQEALLLFQTIAARSGPLLLWPPEQSPIESSGPSLLDPVVLGPRWALPTAREGEGGETRAVSFSLRG